MKKIAPTKAEIALLKPFVGLELEHIHVPISAVEFALAAAEIKAAGIVGFDTESKPTFVVGDVSEGPHVVQFALHDKAYLFQIHRAEGLPFLLELLQSEDLIKVGFGLKSDRKNILAKLGVHFNAVVDLNTVFGMDGYHKEIGVRAAVGLVLKQRFAKSRHVTTSNWSQLQLTAQQMLYAANDAYAALKVLEALGLPREALPIMGAGQPSSDADGAELVAGTNGRGAADHPKRRKHHLVVSISSHGFGHVAQTAPILNALQQRMPKLHITVRSGIPLAHLRSRIKAPFTHLESEGDIGMLMSSALDVCVDDSCAAYQKFHADWNRRVAGEARTLRELNADFVLSNVGYLPLAGAQLAGIPNAALCSLNWADIYCHYCCRPSTGTGGEANEIIAAQIRSCYANADAFLRATPGMAMSNLPNLIPVAPIAAIGSNRRDELNSLLHLAPGEKLALISMGGIASRLPVENWPRIDGVRWLVQESWQVDHPDAIVLESLQKSFGGLSFGDLLASSDALICKPGYGSFVEATCSGVPVLYVGRADWPESPALITWLQQHNPCREVSRDALERGEVAGALAEIWDDRQFRHRRIGQVCPNGAAQAADWLTGKLDL